MINFENYNIGALEFEKHNYSLSVEYFTKAIDENHLLGNSFSLAYFFRASSYFYLKEFHKAIKDYEEASLAMFDDYKLHLFRGLAYFNLKKYDEAILDLNKVINLNEDFEDAYVQLYEIYRIIGSKKKGDEMLHKIIAFDPNNCEIVNKLSIKYKDESFGNLSKVFQLDFFSLFPNDPKAIELSQQIASSLPRFSEGVNSLKLSYMLTKQRKARENTDEQIELDNENKESFLEEKSENYKIEKKMNIKGRVEKAFAALNSLGKDESLESIIKSILISILIGLTICLFTGWITSNERVFYDIGEYSDGRRVERIENSFNYQAGLIFGSISTLFIFIKRLIPNKKQN